MPTGNLRQLFRGLVDLAAPGSSLLSTLAVSEPVPGYRSVMRMVLLVAVWLTGKYGAFMGRFGKRSAFALAAAWPM